MINEFPPLRDDPKYNRKASPQSVHHQLAALELRTSVRVDRDIQAQKAVVENRAIKSHAKILF